MNMGAGKTERFYLGPPDSTATQPVRVTAGVIPLTDNYRNLGVWALNFDDELKRKKGKAWASIKAIDGVWHSCASMDVKRQLFRAIVEPILTYGLCAWPLTVERTQRVDGMFGRLLRYALGLPPAFVSHDLVGTEALYGDIPFLSTMMTSRRIDLIAHTLRAHVDGRTHSLVDALLYDPTAGAIQTLQPRRGPHITVISSVLRQCRVEFPEQLVELMGDRRKSRALVREVERQAQETAYHRIGDRRVLHLLSYFDMPRRAPPVPKETDNLFERALASLEQRRKLEANAWRAPGHPFFGRNPLEVPATPEQNDSTGRAPQPNTAPSSTQAHRSKGAGRALGPSGCTCTTATLATALGSVRGGRHYGANGPLPY